tara:strand:- start:214 stop:624 length:411 start_codon:yes stop_codon:yes gene_type:complete
MGLKPSETGPIEDESSVEQQSLGVAIGILDSVIAEIKDPTSTFLYDITCDKSTHIKDLQEIMTHLEDAYNALEVCELDNADNNRAWANNLLPYIKPLKCGHAPTRCYTEINDGTVDVIAECLKCSYAEGYPYGAWE